MLYFYERTYIKSHMRVTLIKNMRMNSPNLSRLASTPAPLSGQRNNYNDYNICTYLTNYFVHESKCFVDYENTLSKQIVFFPGFSFTQKRSLHSFRGLALLSTGSVSPSSSRN